MLDVNTVNKECNLRAANIIFVGKNYADKIMMRETKHMPQYLQTAWFERICEIENFANHGKKSLSLILIDVEQISAEEITILQRYSSNTNALFFILGNIKDEFIKINLMQNVKAFFVEDPENEAGNVTAALVQLSRLLCESKSILDLDVDDVAYTVKGNSNFAWYGKICDPINKSSKMQELILKDQKLVNLIENGKGSAIISFWGEITLLEVSDLSSLFEHFSNNGGMIRFSAHYDEEEPNALSVMVLASE